MKTFINMSEYKMPTILDLQIAINEMLESEQITQFDFLNREMIHKVVTKAKEIANEED